MLSKLNKYKKAAIPPLSSDVYIVSYPKSGNTWLRFLLSQAIVKFLDIERSANWFNLQEFVPDIDVSRFLPLNSSNSELPRIIKSHAEFNQLYLRVIYLIRNPIEVLESYYYYNNNFEKFKEADFIDSKYGLKPWLNHVESWLRNPRQGQVIKIINYQNLVDDTKSTLIEILSIMGITLQDEDIDEIVKNSSKELMSQSDKKFNSDMRRFTQTSFIRKTDEKENFREKYSDLVFNQLNSSKYKDRIEFVFEKDIHQLIYG